MSIVSLISLDAHRVAAAHGRNLLAAAERERHLGLERSAPLVAPAVRAARRGVPLATLRSFLRPVTT